MNRRHCLALLLLVCVLPPTLLSAEDTATVSLSDGMKPFLQMLSGRLSEFDLRGDLMIRIDGKPQPVKLRLIRFNDDAFDLELSHPEYSVHVRRRVNSTALVLPLHKVAYVGTGDVAEGVRLSPKNISDRLISSASDAKPVVTMLSVIQPEFIDPLMELVKKPLKAERDPGSQQWMLTAGSPVRFPIAGHMVIEADFGQVALSLADDVPSMNDDFGDFRLVEIPRDELERTLARGVHRATEVLAPASILTKPRRTDRKVPHGELRWIEGQRVAILDGTPEQIGTAHGELLHDESMRCIESVLYSFGTVHVIRTGHWFRHDIEAAYARLAPHIPERHQQETRALAAALDLPDETLQILNVFPEMFHCSGFAVFNSATKDGKLYHGRVLDYMTTIGLQDAATTFIVKAEGHHSFANVGYAAFIGSVSGMNSKAISLGEMGGRGEGNWDGVPMATLMRRALEECSTLDEVIQLWTDSPRTCEYYYVFADGKTNQAVGVAAYPESIEFIKPGQGHERLGEGIADTVVLSAGSRLEKLRERVTEKHGQIDAEVAMWLMSRPVAMQSNLHNVLFVPADGVLYVANASHKKPAAEMPYVKLNLNELLNSDARLQTQVGR
ncbi:MAG: C45 family peptidase [Planctomycetaceae bacterium]